MLKRWLTKSKQRRKFLKEFSILREAEKKTKRRFSLTKKDFFPILNEATPTTEFDRHYVFHTAWAARILAETRPTLHTDISSSLYFVSITSAFQRIDFFDFRPPQLSLSKLRTNHCDLLRLHFANGSIASLSCMHVIEHVGLGRYGDPLDYDGDLKAISELKRVVAPGGNILFVVPIGRPVIMFNAHRVYSYAQIMNYFSDFDLKQFALIPDHEADGGLILSASEDLANQQDYGCGCFWFRKPTNL